MKNGLLVCSPRSKSKNIGDYIQSLAQEQFFDHIDCYVERENLSLFKSDEKTKVIMNAWFMWEPEHFPPSENIEPFFISFHVVPKVARIMLSEKAIAYLKMYEPIGTRDTGTKNLLESYGIKCYFSGCLTLTLGLRYMSKIRNGGTYFVDPYYEMCGLKTNWMNIFTYLKVFSFYIRYRKQTRKVLPHFKHEFKTVLGFISKRIENRLCAAAFYRYYRELFSDEMLSAAKFVKHDISVKEGVTNEDLMNIARELMHQYASANLVVTSRIHCGLPCLAVETPTIFVLADVLERDGLRSGGRFGGLVNLFHIVKWTKKGLIPQSSVICNAMINGRICNDNFLTNKSDYKLLRDDMIKKVKEFVSR